MHAGGFASGEIPGEGPALRCEWLEDADPFTLLSWAGGARSLQVRPAGS